MPLAKSGASGYITSTDGVRLYFETRGEAREAILIPNGFYFRDEFAHLADQRKLVIFDLRNRGQSDAISDAEKLKNGVWNDVEDLEAIRRTLGKEKVALIGHSYVGLTVLLYAMKYPQHVSRVISLSPAPADAARKYPPDLAAPEDGVLQNVFVQLGALQKERATHSEEEFCRMCWSALAPLYVANPANAGKVQGWGRCKLANERNFIKYWSNSIFPSLQALQLGADEFARVKAPVLIVHGRKDRSAPYGGARDWAMNLPDAQLLTLEHAAHAPWIEAPQQVMGAIETFLRGSWPESSRRVESGPVPMPEA